MLDLVPHADAEARTSAYIKVDPVAGLFKVNRRNFTDPEILKTEMAAIFDKCWLYVGHDSELAEPNAFLTRPVGGREIIFNRDAEGQVRAFFNVCPHRGGPVCRELSGKARSFRCFYHGWVFNADGTLRHLPFEDAYPEGFASQPDAQLNPVPKLDQYAGFWFLCYDKAAGSLKDYLAGAAEYLDRIASYSATGVSVIPGSHQYSMQANWKLLVENVLDPYHAAPTHASYVEHLKDQLEDLGLAPDGGNDGADLTGDLLIRDLGNGHSVAEATALFGRALAKWHPSWGAEAKVEIDKAYQELVDRLGPEQARRVATRPFNVIIFPNLAIVDQMGTNLRAISPTATGELIARNWTLGPNGESAFLRDLRLRNTLEFLGPAGFGTPDDAAALEACQRGYRSDPDHWNDISGAMLAHRNTSIGETTLRAFWTQYDRRMSEAESRTSS